MTDTDPMKGVVHANGGSLDLDKEMDKSLSIRSEILEKIHQFEEGVVALLTHSEEARSEEIEEGGDAYPIEELVEEGKTQLRLSLFSELSYMFSSLNDPEALPSRTYEEAVYLLLLDRMQRSFGYYQAFARAEEEVRRRNNDIGDPDALSLAVEETQGLLSKLDDIDFARKLCSSLDMNSGDTAEIMSCMIQKGFRGHRG